jgi:hypothetical protein
MGFCMDEQRMPEAYEYPAGPRSCLDHPAVLEFAILYTEERKPGL